MQRRQEQKKGRERGKRVYAAKSQKGEQQMRVTLDFSVTLVLDPHGEIENSSAKQTRFDSESLDSLVLI